MIHGCPGALLCSFSCHFPLCNTTFLQIKKLIQVSVAQSFATGVNGTMTVAILTKAFHKKTE